MRAELPLQFAPNAPTFVRELDRTLFELRDTWSIPDFAEEPIIHVVSDYAGLSEGPIPGDAKQKFRTYSFLFTTNDAINNYCAEIAAVRTFYQIAPTTDISYKELYRNDNLNAALPEIVNAILNIKGFVFSLVVENSIESIFGDADLNHRHALSRGYRVKKGPVERTLRISYSIAYWLSRLVGKDQKCVWLGDRDDVYPNRRDPVSGDSMQSATENVLGQALLWTGFSGSLLGGVALFYIVECDRLARKDLLSVPDLVAGTLARFMSDLTEGKRSDRRGIHTLLGVLAPSRPSQLSNVIYEAKSTSGHGVLHKITPPSDLMRL